MTYWPIIDSSCRLLLPLALQMGALIRGNEALIRGLRQLPSISAVQTYRAIAYYPRRYQITADAQLLKTAGYVRRAVDTACDSFLDTGLVENTDLYCLRVAGSALHGALDGPTDGDNNWFAWYAIHYGLEELIFARQLHKAISVGSAFADDESAYIAYDAILRTLDRAAFTHVVGWRPSADELTRLVTDAIARALPSRELIAVAFDWAFENVPDDGHLEELKLLQTRYERGRECPHILVQLLLQAHPALAVGSR